MSKLKMLLPEFSPRATIFRTSSLQYLFISWNKVAELIKWGQMDISKVHVVDAKYE